MNTGDRGAAFVQRQPKIENSNCVYPTMRAPDELNEGERTVWRDITASGRLDHDDPRVVVQYCRHVVRARRVAKLIAQAEESPELDILQYDKLAAMADRESRAVLALSKKLGLS